VQKPLVGFFQFRGHFKCMSTSLLPAFWCPSSSTIGHWIFLNRRSCSK